MSCGRKKNFFASGYIKIRGNIMTPKTILSVLNWVKIIKPKNKRITKHMIALVKLISPDARGRVLVLSTLESISLSQISLIMQPADLMITEPTKKRQIKRKKFISIFDDMANPKLTG